ncbi:hypothetical protein [Nitrospira sp. Kam-Ns4a]
MSKLSPVEMTIGLESLESQKLDPAQLAGAQKNDMDKLAITNSMYVRWLTYPANKSDDNYSSVDLTFQVNSVEEFAHGMTNEQW